MMTAHHMIVSNYSGDEHNDYYLWL